MMRLPHDAHLSHLSQVLHWPWISATRPTARVGSFCIYPTAILGCETVTPGFSVNRPACHAACDRLQ